jgi:hypothetical protein
MFIRIKKALFFIVIIGFSLNSFAGKMYALELMPQISDWVTKGKTTVYSTENLYEYIDGAADNFIAYDFQELSVNTYAKLENQVTVEIYRHIDNNAAFGIYSSERPLNGRYISVGTQGYYEKSVLNFFAGPYYVKINGFNIAAEADYNTLYSFATAISAKIPNKTKFPAVLSIFPEKNKVINSDRFILQNPFGQSFLHSAYFSDYALGSIKFQCFVICGSDETDAIRMIDSWGRAAGNTRIDGEKNHIVIADKYNGKALLRRNGRYVLGVIGDCPSPNEYLEQMESRIIGF